LKISIIILNYNGKIFLEDCLKSVFSQSFNDFEIIFIDNGSTDDSLNFVKQTFNDKRLKCFSSEENIGFAGGNNLGFKYTTGEYIVLLNNDTIVEKDWLINLYDVIRENDKTGAVQSLVITDGIPLKYYDINGTLNLFGHNIMEVFSIGDNGIGNIFQITGCSLVTRRKTIEDIGGLFLDEYFMYAEDSYFSFKLKFAGYDILHNAKSIVKHRGNSTSKEFKNNFVTFYQERNRILNFLIFFSPVFLIKYFPLLMFNIKIKLLYSIFTGKYSFPGILRAYLWFFKNIKWIKLQRKEIVKYKKVKEEEIIKLLSCKISNGNNLLDKSLNFISLLYCKITRIKVIELK
jgi:GT2 family glycosyltransferase